MESVERRLIDSNAIYGYHKIKLFAEAVVLLVRTALSLTQGFVMESQ